MKIAHIINPVNVTEKSDLFIAQPITFETMRRAKKYARDNNLDVELFYTCYEEDLTIAPKEFTQTKLLEKSILDYREFEKKRKLPLIKDILDRLYESSDAEYFIYTNVDIAVMPHFYTEVKNIIDKGYDGFVINRRTIDKKYTSIEEIPEMYSDIGEKHPGYDCFVFKRDVYPNYELGTACIGANWIGRVIISNVIAYSHKFKVFEDEYLTFHIGDDRSWKISDFNNYDKNNEECLKELLVDYLKKGRNLHDPLLKLFIEQHDILSFMESTIRKSNTVELRLPGDVTKMYGSEFLPSYYWKVPILLRQDPVFIVGYPRSGTTLVQSLLATQDIMSLPETHFFTLIRNCLKVKSGRVTIESLEKAIDKAREKIRLSINAENHLKELAKQQKLSPKMLFEAIVVDNLIDKVDDFNRISQKLWMEKTPDHVLRLDIINNFYPNAKYVFVLRDPEQAILSRRKNFINEANLGIEVHAKRWMDSIHAIETFKTQYPDRVKFVKLEELVENKENIVSDICNFIGIEFIEQKLKNYNDKAKDLVLPWEHWKQDVIGSQVSKEIASNQKVLNDYDLVLFLNITQEKLKQYGYFKQRYKAIQEKKTTYSNSNGMDSLLSAFHELVSVSVFNNPIKKYKAYKKMLQTYHEIKD